MDADRFDRLTQALSRAVSRRGAVTGGLAGLLAGVAAGEDRVDARQRKRKARTKRRNRQRATDGQKRVSAEASCASPGPSTNLSRCNFNGEDFSGDDLSGSRMVRTRFRNAELVGTNLSSSNMRAADFRGANLCGADLSSSTLRQARFQGANLTRADLSSSGCGGARFNAATTFCRTRTCSGAIRDDDCPAGVDPENVCCADAECAQGQRCQDGACVAACTVCETGCPFSSVAAAVGDPSIQDGDTIRICAGTFPTVNADITKNLTLIGAGSGDVPATDTILDGERAGRVLQIASGAMVQLENLRITGGEVAGGVGGGILNNIDGTVTLTGCVVTDNDAGTNGGGIYNDVRGTVTLAAGSHVTDNDAGIDGGGIYNFGGTVTLAAGSRVTDNDADEFGGGIFNFGGGTVNVAADDIVTGNTAAIRPHNCDGAPVTPPENCVG